MNSKYHTGLSPDDTPQDIIVDLFDTCYMTPTELVGVVGLLDSDEHELPAYEDLRRIAINAAYAAASAQYHFRSAVYSELGEELIRDGKTDSYEILKELSDEAGKAVSALITRVIKRYNDGKQ